MAFRLKIWWPEGGHFNHELEAIPRAGEFIRVPGGLIEVQKVIWPAGPHDECAAYLDCRQVERGETFSDSRRFGSP